MDRTVVALFDYLNTAQQAFEELQTNGFNRSDISVVRTNEHIGTTAGTEPEPSGTATGAGVGAVLGGLAGLVVGVGALAIPGIGPIVAAGPLAATLAGAGIGAATGGVIGALADAGIPANEAEYYAEGIRRGGTLLTVHVNEDRASRAVEILQKFSPVDIKKRAEEWRSGGWAGFEGNAAAYTGADTRRFEDFENEFRNDFDTRYRSKGFAYERYRPAYQYGWEAHHLFGGRDWKAIEPDLQADWQHTHPGDAWDDFKDAVRMGWERLSAGAGDTSRDVERGFDRTTGDMSRDFDRYERDFRNDYDQSYHVAGYEYERFRPAYQYGYNLATENRGSTRKWHEIEADARPDWEAQHPSDPWEEFKGAVRRAYQRVRSDAGDAMD